MALQITNLEAGYVKGLPILHQVSLCLKPNSLTTIIGPNGAGKSTLIKAVAGLLPVSAGQIVMGGKSIDGIRPDQMGELGISYVPQTDNVFRTLTIRQNLLLVLRRIKARASRLSELYNLFPPLAEKQHEKAGSLSGGQRQMLAVAMALGTRPSVLLMDAPSAGLAPNTAQEVLELVRGLTGNGVSILLVEQNVKQALAVSDYCYILADGRNQIEGAAKDILSDPLVAEIYLGGERVEAS